jgi:hypothetical protein
MKHTQACLLAQERYEREMAAWLMQWGATYCRDCCAHGRGLEIGYPHEPDSVWTCSSCLDPQDDRAPVCPRCGKPGVDTETDENPCPHCGWFWGQLYDDCLPSEHTCYCDEGPTTDELFVPLFVDELPRLLRECNDG